MATVNFMQPDIQADQEQIQRNRLIAEQLRQQSQQPLQGGMAGRVYVGPSITQGLAKLLQSYQAGQMGQQADADTKRIAALLKSKNDADVAGFTDAIAGKPAQYKQSMADMGEIDPSLAGMGPVDQQTAPAISPDRNRALQIALGSQLPALQGAGAELLKRQVAPKNVVVGRSLVNENTGQVVGTDSTWQQEQAAMRDQRMAELAQKAADARATQQERAEAQRQLADMQNQARQDLARLAAGLRPAPQPHAPVSVMGPDGKPVYVSAADAVGKTPASKTGENKLPASALKMQQEELDAIALASSIDADMGGAKSLIDSGKLELGPVKNLVGQAKNFVGASDENSRNLATFKATLEKLRNDSLRLNKGVQTEGDAVRAWNEILTNINDPKVVSKRLGEIQEINRRAANIRKMNVDQIRSNFGVEPLNTQPYSAQPAVGAPAAPKTPGIPSMSDIDAELARRRGGK